MNTRRFLIDTAETVFGGNPGAADSPAKTITVSGDEYHHLKQVNRARPGDEIEAIDGNGLLIQGRIREFKPRNAIIDIEESIFQEKPPCRLIVAPSLLKQRPMSIMIEKLTEMGVDEIQPLIFQRTDEKYNPSRLDKWQKVATQSLKVNKQLWQTDIRQPVKLEQWLNNMPSGKSKSSSTSRNFSGKILLDIVGAPALNSIFSPQFPDIPLPLIAVIGPPGDISPDERDRLLDSGFTAFNISDAILKTETAAISIAAILKEFLNHREQGNRNAA